jgi:uncharacterized SAM-binding protein YcdF (DUF218 family)
LRRRIKLLLWTGAIFLILASAAILFHRPLLRAYAGLLYESQAPGRAGAIVVLAGGANGDRILKAGELLAAGHAPYALVSDPAQRYYGQSECLLALAFASARGYDRTRAYCVPTYGNSTREESVALIAELRRRNVRSILLVTSDFHTGRAAYVYRRAVPEMTLTVVPARGHSFVLDNWWTNREGRKQVFFESTKNVAERLGL